MIRLYQRNEKSFNHNKNVLSPISCYAIEEENGLFEIEIEVDKNTVLENGQVIAAPTPRGMQPFRIYREGKSLKGKKIYAKHIFYDLAKNMIMDLSYTNVVCQTALQGALSSTEYNHDYTATSDVLIQNSIKLKRVNPVQAILGDEGIISNWGGNLVRDGYSITIKASGLDRGYEIRVGKNLIGIEGDADESNVKTRIYPVVELDNKTLTLPEKYVDSPIVNNYGEPIIAVEEIKLTDEQKALADSEIYVIMRSYCNDLFSIYNVDKPIVNYKINFVELSKTEQYKDIAILEQLDLYDIVTCKITQLDINVKAKVIKYKYDCLKEKYESIELGDFKAISKYQTDNIVKKISERIKANESAVEFATNTITGNKGGYVITRRYPNGKPYEILIMDTEDINTAQNAFRLNNSGLGFSKNGYNGPYGTAMTIDGHIVADFIDTGTLTAILLQSANLQTDDEGKVIQGSRFNLTDGLLETANGIFKGKIIGSIIEGANISGGSIYSIGSRGATEISEGQIETSYVHMANEQYETLIVPSEVKLSDGVNVTHIYPDSMYCKEIYGVGLLNDGVPITSANKSGMISTTDISVSLTPDGNLNFPGSENAAAVNWVQTNYYTRSYCDSSFAPKTHTHSYATSSDLASLETSIKNWVTANFAPKS